ncbi:hypothetical protein AKG11_00790 [Shinella sp. SUS2]|uniref:winged helix-turn-helix domain-containing tetratricopeptide repeat protein n=1 Tax=unclassified Shinella TaxID=2643062 RepID=UPI0006A56B20|nr:MULTISPECIES: winged helix-turn-helix domain-containing protein [unclassified Shinella]KNY18684.1 hypothetical protein AKG11_00790 [Shinella sp. SUS2]KOC76532.1 hypothetical protein AKG10_06235 [Shinella sp. GWS1]
MLFFSGFALDPDRAELRGPDGAVIRLRPKAFELLRLLVANSHQLLPKRVLLDTVWPGVHVGEDSLFQCIREIRAALGDHERQMVKLVSGRGYLFAVDVSTATDAKPAIQALPIEASGVSSRFLRTRRTTARMIAGGATAALLLGAFAIVKSGLFSDRSAPVVEVMSFVDTTAEPREAALARGVSAQLIAGLSRIDGLQLIASAGQATAARTAPTHLVQGELRKSAQSWILQTRLIDTASREVLSVVEAKVDAQQPDAQRVQSRLAASVGYTLALKLGRLREDSPTPGSSTADIAIQQAAASINQTTKERFATARTILETYLAGDPDNIDLQVALATLHLRGIQMTWYSPVQINAAENDARKLLKQAVAAQPLSGSAMGAYCRFLTATNQFAERLVTCTKTLSLNPWDGAALFQLGLTQLQLGRFEDAFATFLEADGFDTPDVSRWTWLLGAGLVCIVQDRNEEALGWLRRSIAITPASGRAHMLLAVAYHRLGRDSEAKEALAKGLALRPGTTATNIALRKDNASDAYLRAAGKISSNLVEIGLPP